MKLSEMEGQTLTVKLNGSDTMIAVLKEIRPIGFLFEVKSSDSGTYCAGQHVFMSTSCPITFSTV
jgi:hypothetical protein